MQSQSQFLLSRDRDACKVTLLSRLVALGVHAPHVAKQCCDEQLLARVCA